MKLLSTLCMCQCVAIIRWICEAALTSRRDHVFQVGSVIKDDLITSFLLLKLLAATHSLQHSFQTPVESGEVGLRQQWSHAVKGIVGERGPHDITETILRQRQETQAKPGGVTDSGERWRRIMEKKE